MAGGARGWVAGRAGLWRALATCVGVSSSNPQVLGTQPPYATQVVTSFHSSRENELNKLTSLPMCGFIAQFVEHRTSIAEVMGSNPVKALIFFQASFFQFTAMIILHFDLQPQFKLFRIYFT